MGEARRNAEHVVGSGETNLGLVRLLLYARTLVHLKPEQIFNRLMRPWIARRHPRDLLGHAGAREIIRPAVPFLSPPGGSGVAGEIQFLHQSRPLSVASPEWSAAEMPKLWRYNLHYFDYLHWSVYDLNDKVRLIDSWIRSNAPGTLDAWEPYPISLRAVNWVKWFWTAAPVQSNWHASLAVQLAWLNRDIEYHLLANHLLKNAKALVFGGLYFTGREADEMLRKGVGLLVEQGREQILADGGHFERSPMYHAIALEDYLDVVNVLSANRELVRPDQLTELAAVASRALTYFGDTLAADGEICLFNDSAIGITAPAQSLLAYGRAVLGLGNEPTRSMQLSVVVKPDSGYFGYRVGGESWLIDCGPCGPDYQPGHTHADALSYELCLDGRRIIVDSGTFNYEADASRRYLRGTSAHNTVRIDGEEQTEVWGVFRVARRARPLFAELRHMENGHIFFRGAHDGYQRLPGRLIHERRVTVIPGKKWDIRDLITGRGDHQLESFINLHPDCSLRQLAERDFVVFVDTSPLVRIVASSETVAEITVGTYCPEFGKLQKTQKLVLRCKATLPVELGYTIERI
jgi:uncharacterized heparinase superfamily protein